MRTFFGYALFFLLLFVFVSCENEARIGGTGNVSLDDIQGCISGKITFYNTGEVTDAYVRLLLPESQTAIYSCLINRFGDYEINNVDTGNYVIRIHKQGFVDTIFPGLVYILPKSLTGGECRKMDCAISMLPPRMQLLEVNTDTPLDTLDFGTTDTKLYFRIYNGSGQVCAWTSDFNEVRQQNKWLKVMSPMSGSVKPNETSLVSVEIDRERLDFGEMNCKVAKFLIKSDHSGGCVLTVLAKNE